MINERPAREAAAQAWKGFEAAYQEDNPAQEGGDGEAQQTTTS
jgi:hypothetical protein